MSEQLLDLNNPDDWERYQNAWSILGIPYDQLPDTEARMELMEWALEGQDVYAYTKPGSCEWVLWVRQADPAAEARFSPIGWSVLWHMGLQPKEPTLEDRMDATLHELRAKGEL